MQLTNLLLQISSSQGESFIKLILDVLKSNIKVEAGGLNIRLYNLVDDILRGGIKRFRGSHENKVKTPIIERGSTIVFKLKINH